MPNRLNIIRINRIALCEQGMNPEAHIVLWKAGPPMSMTASTSSAHTGGTASFTLSSSPGTFTMAAPPFGSKKPTAGAPASSSEASGFKPKPKPRGGKVATKKSAPAELDLDALELDDVVKKDITDFLHLQLDEMKSLADENAELVARITELEALDKSEKKTTEPSEDELLKSVPQSVRDRLAKAEEQAKDSAETVAKLLRKSREQEFTAIAKEYSNVGTSDELGMLLLDVADHVPEATLKSLQHVLKTANARIDITKEFGSAIIEVNDDLEKAVTSIRRAEPKLTREQAVARALNENPQLYKAVG